MNWQESANSLSWNIQPFIDGDYRPSSSTECVDNINPANETSLCRFAVGSAADVHEAVRIARVRFDDGCWSELSIERRAEILFKLANLVVRHKAELALLDTLEMGKPIRASLDDAEYAAPLRVHSWVAGLSDKLLGVTTPMSSRSVAFNMYEPRGVVGALTPWNFPLLNTLTKIVPALAAGNTVVLKPSEVSPSSALRLAELAVEAGVPEGVLNVVPGLGSTAGAALALHPDIDLISFTGSTATGRKIIEMSGRSNGKPLLLECGGKSPHVVFDDVDDLDRVAAATVQGLVRNQGQVCSAHTRLLVHKAVKKKLLEKVIFAASHYHPGDPLDERTIFGPLASPAQRDRVKNYIEQGLKSGAVAVLRGTVMEAGGCHVSPTIFDGVDSTMSIAREEIFGPVLSVQHFGTEEEAIALANGTEYGLGATVWTRDMGRGKRMARAIRAGYVSVKTSGVEDPRLHLLSFEPQKASGFGVEFGHKGLESYSTLKAVSFSGA